ncbi:MAG: PH domain-containing protein [Phycisphaerae bacterium]|nr:PH domain-containing protein [Phycisphaerae bacterium]NUQ46519.1 PH domain-containing protein [Phycisphaerae bacterium]
MNEPLSTLEAARVDDDVAHHLHPNIVRVEMLSNWIVTGILCTVLAVVVTSVIIKWDLGFAGRMALALPAGVFALFLALFSHYWPAIEYRCRTYRINAGGIEIQRGVLWKETLYVPRSRVQHTDVNQGPIERRFGLAHLIIFTAGTIGASVRLAGLGHDDALRIRDFLVASESGDAV